MNTTDDLYARAERELTTSPHTTTLPPGFTWPDKILKEAARVETLRDKWQTANDNLGEAMLEYENARDLDAAALVAAIKAGAKGHPGNLKTDAAQLALEFAITATRMAREEAEAAARGPINDMIVSEAASALEQARQAVKDAEEHSAATVTQIQGLMTEANRRRHLAMLMAAHAATVNGSRISSSSAGTSVSRLELRNDFDPAMRSTTQMLDIAASQIAS